MRNGRNGKTKSVPFLRDRADAGIQPCELIDAHVLPSGDEKVFMPELLFTIAVETTGRRKSFEEK